MVIHRRLNGRGAPRLGGRFPERIGGGRVGALARGHLLVEDSPHLLRKSGAGNQNERCKGECEQAFSSHAESPSSEDGVPEEAIPSFTRLEAREWGAGLTP